MTVWQMLKPDLAVLADIIPHVTDGMATMACIVPLDFGYCCVKYLCVTGGTATVADVKPQCDENM